jgi:hypothetical protein
MSNSSSHRFPVTVTHLPVMRCQICHRTVGCRPGNGSEVLTEHYRRANQTQIAVSRYDLAMLRQIPSFGRVIAVISLVTLIVAVTGCSGGSSSGVPGGSGGTGLESALSRVADTASTRSQVTYDNTAELVHLAGKNPAPTKGFAGLRGLGASTVADTADLLPGDAGFDLFGEDYGISAGSPSQTLSLMAGGQSASQITSHLTSLGWKRSGIRLVGPSPLTASSDAGLLAEDMAQVLPTGSDVVFGRSAASLSQIGSPQGATLASDPGISALAQCLGNVVAAGIFSGGYLGGKQPAALAVGVSQPASNTAAPHAVVCVSWPSQAAAAGYAAELRQALSTGVSPTENVPYATLLTHATVTTVGGSQHVVKWQADTPENAQTVFQMADSIGLPALPDCARLPASAAARVIGCH